MNEKDITQILSQLDGGQTQKIDVAPYLKTALKHWKFIVKFSLVGLVVGILLALSMPKSYTTTAIVAPELTTRTTSGLSSLANLAGINMNAMAVTDAMHADLYPTILKSSSFAVSLFDKKVRFKDGRKGQTQTEVYDYILNHIRQPWFSAVFALPHKIGDLFRDWFSSDTVEESGYETLEQTSLTREQTKVVKYLSKNISAVVDKKSYAIKITVKMQDAYACSDIANAVIDQLQDFVQEYRTRKARHNLEYYEKIRDEAKDNYYRAQSSYAKYMDENQGISLQSVLIEKDRLMNEVNLLYQVYNQLSQQVQTGRAKVQEASPVFVVIQPGVKPLDGSPSKVKAGLLFMMLACCISLLFVFKKNE